MASGSMHAFGMISAFLGNRLGFANVIVLGGVVCTVGMVSSSFAKNVYLLYLTYGLVWGFGSCLCYCSALFLLPQFFRARLGLANGIVFLGAPVGTLVYSVLIQKLLSYMGLAKSFRVLAGVQLVLVLCGLITRSIVSLGFDQTEFKTIKKASFDWSIFKNKGFMVFVVSLFVFMPGYLVPYVHLVSSHILHFVVSSFNCYVHPLFLPCASQYLLLTPQGKGTPYSGLHGEAPIVRGTFFSLRA